MTHVHAFTGAGSTPGPLVIRTIGVMDLKDALARGMSDFSAMPTHAVFLCLIYPIVGLILAPLTGSFVGHALAEPQMPASWVTTVGGGLLVGFGTRQGGGCTSGHGVCGVARLSVRSIAATAIFMATAVVVVFLARHAFGS